MPRQEGPFERALREEWDQILRSAVRREEARINNDWRPVDTHPIEATRCDVCGCFSIVDECCGRGKRFDSGFYYGDIFSGRPGSTIRYSSRGDRRPGSELAGDDAGDVRGRHPPRTLRLDE